MVKISKFLFVGLVVLAVSTFKSVFAQGNSDPVVFSGSVFILQDFMDNFEHGLNAGGSVVGFGDDLEFFGIEDGIDVDADRDGDPDISLFPSLHRDNFSAILVTNSDGFSASNNGIIGLTKTFATSTAADGSTSNSIDASAFNSISYWARSLEADASSTASMEFVIGAGGDFVNRDTNGNPVGTDRFFGSTWTQKDPVKLTTTFARITRLLNQDQFTQAFGRTVTVDRDNNGDCLGSVSAEDCANSNEGDDIFDKEDLKNITAINVVFNSGGNNAAVRKTFLVDDINFFANPQVLTAAIPGETELF